jgi:hypothetical protein
MTDSPVARRRRHVWVSVSADLMYDAMRDLRDIGAGVIPVKSITDCDYTRIDGRLRRGHFVIILLQSPLYGESL